MLQGDAHDFACHFAEVPANEQPTEVQDLLAEEKILICEMAELWHGRGVMGTPTLEGTLQCAPNLGPPLPGDMLPEEEDSLDQARWGSWPELRRSAHRHRRGHWSCTRSSLFVQEARIENRQVDRAAGGMAVVQILMQQEIECDRSTWA